VCDRRHSRSGGVWGGRTQGRQDTGSTARERYCTGWGPPGRPQRWLQSKRVTTHRWLQSKGSTARRWYCTGAVLHGMGPTGSPSAVVAEQRGNDSSVVAEQREHCAEVVLRGGGTARGRYCTAAVLHGMGPTGSPSAVVAEQRGSDSSVVAEQSGHECGAEQVSRSLGTALRGPGGTGEPLGGEYLPVEAPGGIADGECAGERQLSQNCPGRAGQPPAGQPPTGPGQASAVPG
jgi:hypothetical protein